MHAPQVCWQRAQKDSSEPRALVCSHSVAALARWHSGAVPRSRHVAIGWNPKRSSGQLTAALAAAAAAAAAAAVADAADMDDGGRLQARLRIYNAPFGGL